jgi:hypothetical protein
VDGTDDALFVGSNSASGVKVWRTPERICATRARGGRNRNATDLGVRTYPLSEAPLAERIVG